MADQPTNPRVEELRNRLNADPKSRLFYPLAEELRKLKRFDDAEKILREGLEVHTSYLSAWISFGRVLRSQRKNGEAIEVLEKALVLDPGNVVAARLLAEAYEETGETIQAVQKFKLVAALLPADEEVTEKIARLEAEIQAADSPAETERMPLPEEEVPLLDRTADMPRPHSVAESTAEPAINGNQLEVPQVEESGSEAAEAYSEPGIESTAGNEEAYATAEVEPPAVTPDPSVMAEGATAEPSERMPESVPEREVAVESSPFDDTTPLFSKPLGDEAAETGDVLGATAEPAIEPFAEEEPWEPTGPVYDEPSSGHETVRPVSGLAGPAGELAEPEPVIEPEAASSVERMAGGSMDGDSIRRRKIERLERWVAKVGVKGRGGDHL